MAIEGVDYAWGRPNPAVLAGMGKKFACRYLSWLPNGKVMTADEVRALAAAGIAVVSNWEYYGDWDHDYSGGYTKGRQHAIEADRQHRAYGGPPDRPIYFSTDFAPTADQMPTVGEYYRGVASEIGIARTGAYGGIGTVRYLFDRDLIKWGWQTYAWSGGAWDGRAQIQQYRNGVWIDGVDCDLDRALTVDYGQWGLLETAKEVDMIQVQNGATIVLTDWSTWCDRSMNITQLNALSAAGVGRVSVDTPTVERILKLPQPPLGSMSDLAAKLDALAAEWAGEKTRDAATTAAITALRDQIAAGSGDVNTAAIIGRINEVAQAEAALLAELRGRLDEIGRLRLALAAAERAGAEMLDPGSTPTP